ncbi:MAG: VWA domain-containing protein [Clostridiales Family XIII bacterium]|nr:VWA domain-containing protein [Clostridiales Family XIII bacterium]
MNEWMSLTCALEKGLADSSLTGFYHICRNLLVKREADFDTFDVAFAAYFNGVLSASDLPEEFWQWLDSPQCDVCDRDLFARLSLEFDELRRMFDERKREQNSRHDGGSYWIGTGGMSAFGNRGHSDSGIRAGGEGVYGRAVQIAGERRFRDFRRDRVIDTRQFETAFRRLRQFSSRVDSERTELDIDGTARETSKNAGLLTLVYERPRRNAIKLLVLFDSDGSMLPYSKLTSRLFKAVSRSNHFKDTKFYYFHNCVYEKLYTDPHIRRGRWVDTERVMKDIGPDYRVIYVGDAAMAPGELERKGGNTIIGLPNDEPGRIWLERLKRRFPRSIWLNPIVEDDWAHAFGQYTIREIASIFPMYGLTLDGLGRGVRRLLATR